MKKIISSDIKRRLPLFAFIVCSILFVTASGCKKKTPPAPQTGAMSDRDGNVYNTIKIGNQWWMASDLKVKTYQNGDSVIYEPDSIKWVGITPAYCFTDQTIGLLYNWYAVNDARKLAPTGWHIPSDAEWQTLETYLGMSAADANKVNWRGTDQGDKLKTTATSTQVSGTWAKPYNVFTVWPNNESGFSALAGSCRLFNGRFGGPGDGYIGFWWSSTLYNNQAWYRYLDYDKSNVFRFYGDQRYGCSIRCVKD